MHRHTILSFQSMVFTVMIINDNMLTNITSLQHQAFSPFTIEAFLSALFAILICVIWRVMKKQLLALNICALETSLLSSACAFSLQTLWVIKMSLYWGKLELLVSFNCLTSDDRFWNEVKEASFHHNSFQSFGDFNSLLLGCDLSESHEVIGSALQWQTTEPASMALS